MNGLVETLMSFAIPQSCTARSYGGGMLVEMPSAFLNLTNTTFTACQAQIAGGALAAIQGASLVMTNPSFFENSAQGLGGGALYSKYGDIEIKAPAAIRS